MSTKIETARLLLKPTTITDAVFVLELLNTPKWKQYIGDRNVNSLEEATKYIEERMLPQFKKLGFGNYTVFRKSDNLAIGSCGIYSRELLEEMDLGFAFLPQFEKLGYAFESSTAVLNLAKNRFNLQILWAITALDNAGSQTLLTKLGFKFEKEIFLGDDPEKLKLYTINL